MADMAWCDVCDLERSMCVHGLHDHQIAREQAAPVRVSPRGMAHFDGCPHKGDDPNYDLWGQVNEKGAWQRLGNGESIRVVDATGHELVATSRCSDCVDHGPW